MSSTVSTIHPRDWLLLILLSVLWGGSFFFVGVALKELPPLTIVFLRVAVAAIILLAFIRWRGVPLPSSVIGWQPYVVMALLNNGIPFSALVAGQSTITSGLAAVLNATTPLFTVLIMAAAAQEPLSFRRLSGVLVGLTGVILLAFDRIGTREDYSQGILLCLCAAISYGFAALHARRSLAHSPPLLTAACQLTASALVMAVIAGVADRPWQAVTPSFAVVVSVIALALFSTALAYVVFFKILERSGATNVSLVTLLIPVTAILLGVFVLGEAIRAREIAGAVIIASALLIIDGRVLAWLRSRWISARA